MKNSERQIFKHGLKVVGLEIVCGRASIENVKENRERRHVLYGEVNLIVHTSQGTLNVQLAQVLVKMDNIIENLKELKK